MGYAGVEFAGDHGMSAAVEESYAYLTSSGFARGRK